MTDLIVFAILNTLSFILFGLDAFHAKSGRKPLPRALLIVSVICGGGFGALCAIVLYKHLTDEGTFRVLVPVFAVLQVVVAALVRIFLF